MSEQEAIQVFQELLDVPKEMLVRHEYALYEEQKEKINKVYLAEQIAIKALEKQIPKKPKIIKHKFSNFYTCPFCDLELIRCDETGWFAGRRNTYCYDCGQKLDWKGEE